MNTSGSDAPHLQTDRIPRWLNYSGLSQALGLTKWSVFKALVETQSRLMHLQPGQWHTGDVFGPFAVRVTAQLPRAAGTDAKTVRKALKALDQDGLIVYEPGGARTGGINQFSEITVCQPMIEALAWYALPVLPTHLGGIANLERLPERLPVWLAHEICPIGYTRDQLEEMLRDAHNIESPADLAAGRTDPKTILDLFEHQREVFAPLPPDWAHGGAMTDAMMESFEALEKTPPGTVDEKALFERACQAQRDYDQATHENVRRRGLPWPPEPISRYLARGTSHSWGFTDWDPAVEC